LHFLFSQPIFQFPRICFYYSIIFVVFPALLFYPNFFVFGFMLLLSLFGIRFCLLLLAFSMLNSEFSFAIAGFFDTYTHASTRTQTHRYTHTRACRSQNGDKILFLLPLRFDKIHTRLLIKNI